MLKNYKGTVLIAGGAGFIGSHLCDKFIDDYEVICVDNFISGRAENIEHLFIKDNFTFLDLDVTKLELKYFIERFDKIDYIFHFASLANLLGIINYPIETMLANSQGTFNLLNMAGYYESKFILASTSEIYGNPNIHPQNEDYWGNVNSIGIRSVYDESKRFAETITMNYFRQFGINVKIVRIFNTYGPRMACDGRVVLNFIEQILSNKDITIYGDGQQTRSFCYIDDLIDGIYKLANSELNFPVNLGNPEEISIKDLAIKILNNIESRSKIVYNSLPLDDPNRRQPDITKAKSFLKWEPKINLNEGLQKMITYYRENK